MRTALALLLLTTFAAPTRAGVEIDTHALGLRLVARLVGRPTAVRPQIHDTDFSGDTLGCITLQRYEMRGLGYPGHAFLCEDAASGEVQGAVLSRSGRVICRITGEYTGDACYGLTICDVIDSLCVR